MKPIGKFVQGRIHKTVSYVPEGDPRTEGNAMLLVGSDIGRLAALCRGSLASPRMFRGASHVRALPREWRRFAKHPLDPWGNHGKVRKLLRGEAGLLHVQTSPAMLKGANCRRILIPETELLNRLVEVRAPAARIRDWHDGFLREAADELLHAGYRRIVVVWDAAELADGADRPVPRDSRSRLSLLRGLLGALADEERPGVLANASHLFFDWAGTAGFRIVPRGGRVPWQRIQANLKTLGEIMKGGDAPAEAGTRPREPRMPARRRNADVSELKEVWGISDSKALEDGDPWFADGRDAAASLLESVVRSDPAGRRGLRSGEIEVDPGRLVLAPAGGGRPLTLRRIAELLDAEKRRVALVDLDRLRTRGIVPNAAEIFRDGGKTAGNAPWAASFALKVAGEGEPEVRLLGQRGASGGVPPIRVVLARPESSEDVVREAVERIKAGIGYSPAVPPADAEEEMLDRIYQLLVDRAARHPDVDWLEAGLADPEVARLRERLLAARVSARKALEGRELLARLKSRQDAARVLANGTETALAERLEKVGSKTFSPERADIDTIGDEVRHSSSAAFREAYTPEIADRDMYAMLSSFGEADDIPVFVDRIERTDASTAENHVDLVKVRFMVPGGRPQTMRVQIPRVSDDGYLFLNGKRKIITNQVVSLPIVKIKSRGEDVVQYTTAHAKIIFSRSKRGTISPAAAGFQRALRAAVRSGKLKGRGWEVFPGAAANSNPDPGALGLEYNELAQSVARVRAGGVTVHFSAAAADAALERTGRFSAEGIAELKRAGWFPVAASASAGWASSRTGEIRRIADKGGRIGDKTVSASLASWIRELLRDAGAAEFAEAAAPERSTARRHLHSRVRVVGVDMPLIAYLGHMHGLPAVLSEYGVDHSFRGGARRPPGSEGAGLVRFGDGWLVHDASDVQGSLLLSGLGDLDAAGHEWADFGEGGDAYRAFFASEGRPRLARGLANFHHVFVDPITREILEDMDLPSDILGSFLHCNSLLSTPEHRDKSDMSLYRVRNNELINTLLYDAVSQNIRGFRDEGAGPHASRRLTLPEDYIVKKVVAEPAVKDVALLNPVREADIQAQTTYKGFGGFNLAHPKGSENIRAFSESMTGIYGVTTPDSGDVGATRKLSHNTRVSSVRGYLEPPPPGAKPTATSTFSTTELLQPFTTTHADPPRIGMTVAQHAHQIPTESMHPPLVSSGAHKAIAAQTKSDFVFRARAGGKVVEAGDDLIILEYDDGTRGALDMSVNPVDAPEGFSLDLRLKPVRALGKGSRFRKGETLAYNPSFFAPPGGRGGPSLLNGTLAKIALTPTAATYEDSSVITERLADKLSSVILVSTDLRLRKNDSIDLKKTKAPGDPVNAAEELCVYEEALEGDEGKDVTKFLDALGSEIETAGLGRNAKLSKHTGTVVDVKVWWNHPIEEYSPTLQTFLRAYKRRHSGREGTLRTVRKEQIVRRRGLEAIKDENPRVGGEQFDGVLIRFFVETRSRMGIGDKTSLSVALKNIVADIIPRGREPVSDHRPETPVDIVMSPMSVVSRMTQDFFLLMWTNKVLVELKERIREIADPPPST